MHGKKKIMLIALIPFVIGSIVCALPFSVIPMIIGRGLQGLATGMIPVTLSLIGAVVVLLLWGWWELRRRGPLVDLRATAKPVVALTNLASLMIGFSMYVQSLVRPQIMQFPEATGYGFGLTVLIMGLLMAPAGLAMMLVSSPGAASTRRWGAKVTLVVGALAMAIGYAGSAMSTGTLWGLVLASVLTSAGTGFAFGSMPALIMANVPAREKAASNGFNSLMRALGTTVAAAVIGGILAAMTQPMGEHQVPTESAFITSLLIGCAVSVVAAIVAVGALQLRHDEDCHPCEDDRAEDDAPHGHPSVLALPPRGRVVVVPAAPSAMTRSALSQGIVPSAVNPPGSCVVFRPKIQARMALWNRFRQSSSRSSAPGAVRAVG